MNPEIQNILRRFGPILFFVFIISPRFAFILLIFGAIWFFAVPFLRGKFTNPKAWVKNDKKIINLNIPKMNKSIFSVILTSLIVIVGISVVIDGLVSVPAGNVAVIYDRGRGTLDEALGEGLHFKIPFWQKATLMSTRLQTYTMSTNLSAADRQNNLLARSMGSSSFFSREANIGSEKSNAVYSLTKDGQRVSIDLSVQFHISATSAGTLFREIGINYVDKIVRPAARSVVRESVTGFESKELFNIETRQGLEQQIEDSIHTKLAGKDIILDDVLVRNVAFSDIYLRAIEEKQIAEQKIQKAEFERQEALKIKERKIIEASAEAEAIILRGAALSKYPEIIELEKINKLNPNIKWGVLPQNVLPLIDLKSMQ